MEGLLQRHRKVKYARLLDMHCPRKVLAIRLQRQVTARLHLYHVPLDSAGWPVSRGRQHRLRDPAPCCTAVIPLHLTNSAEPHPIPSAPGHPVYSGSPEGSHA